MSPTVFPNTGNPFAEGGETTMAELLLYHGSNVRVDAPRLIPSKRLLDFGAGFYLTSDLGQARKWAARTANNRGEGAPLVSVFALDRDALAALDVLTFAAPDAEWLRYVAANRTGRPTAGSPDVVIGPVADDQAVRTINNFLKGYFPEEIAIRLLLPQKLKDQYAFKTDRALALLRFREVIGP